MPLRLAAAFALLAATTAPAQPVTLAETAKPGDGTHMTLDLTVTGQLVVGPQAARDTVKLEAKARHVFAERVLLVEGGLPQQSARHYEQAGSTAVVGGERIERSLSAERRTIVARRTPEGTFCFAPSGPLLRDELDLVAEHFNTHCLPGLLPGQDANANDTWPVSDAAAQCAGQFHRLIKNGLVGKMLAANAQTATFSIEGTLEGIEHGGSAKLTVKAVGTFDIASRRIAALNWTQKDERSASAVGPASQVEATIVLKRESLPALPPTLADAALSGVPTGEVPTALAQLRYADPSGRFSLLHAREWHVTGEAESHLILRLLDRGEFVAQATLAAWKPLPPGKHLNADEFKKAVAGSKGWTAAKVLDDREVPIDGGRWLYRYSAEGTLDGQPAVQSFHLLAGPHGEQIVAVFTTTPDKVKALAGRDLALVSAIEFARKK